MIRVSWSFGLGSMVMAACLAVAFPASAESDEPAACGATKDPVHLNLTIQNVRSAKGTIAVSVYGDRPEDFLAKGQKLRKIRFPAQTGTVHGCISLPKTGTYALVAYHDEDGDHHFTKNFLGLPTEGAAVSNDPTVVLVPPSFSEAAFHVDANTARLTVTMKYP